MSKAAVPDIGLQRISLVRVLLDAGAARAEAVGLGHRLPRVAPISLATAGRLAAAGVPTVVRSAEAGGR